MPEIIPYVEISCISLYHWPIAIERESLDTLDNIILYVEEPLEGCPGCSLVINGSIEVANSIQQGIITVVCNQKWVDNKPIGKVTAKGYDINGKSVGYSEKSGDCQSLL